MKFKARKNVDNQLKTLRDLYRSIPNDKEYLSNEL